MKLKYRKNFFLKSRLFEKLRDVTEYNDFTQVINSEELEGLMSLPLRELFKREDSQGHNYKYFITDYESLPSEIISRCTLKDVLLAWRNSHEKSLALHPESTTKLKVYVSESEKSKEILGLVYYYCRDDNTDNFSNSCVFDMGMMSFNLEKPNMIFTHDILELIDNLLEEYDSVKWFANRDNPAVKTYQKLCTLCNGVCRNNISNKNVVDFEIIAEDYLDSKGQELARRWKKNNI